MLNISPPITMTQIWYVIKKKIYENKKRGESVQLFKDSRSVVKHIT